jgi:predicted RNA-binding Zn ribbon-like protein
MSASPNTLFDLCGGHPALDFVNSLDNRYREDGPNEMLTSYADLLRFLTETHLLDPHRARVLSKSVAPDTAERVIQSVRALREATAAVLYSTLGGEPPSSADLRLLEKYFLEASRHRELHWEGADVSAATGDQPRRAGLLWRWGRHASEPDLPVWILADAVSDILLSDQMTHVRTCAVDTCRWLFLDTSKNHSRRWCNMRVCGNRMKARRFQAKRDS